LQLLEFQFSRNEVTTNCTAYYSTTLQRNTDIRKKLNSSNIINETEDYRKNKNGEKDKQNTKAGTETQIIGVKISRTPAEKLYLEDLGIGKGV
jgi:hypothetical protein